MQRSKKTVMKNLLSITALLFSMALFFSACSENRSNTKTEQLAENEMHTCTMHNEVMSDHEGKCPKCGMNLTKQKMTEAQQKMMNEGTYTKPKE